jgi:hypothetical protein
VLVAALAAVLILIPLVFFGVDDPREFRHRDDLVMTAADIIVLS